MPFSIVRSGDPRPTLLVWMASRVDDVLDELKEEMHRNGVANGLAFDEEQCVILRDTFTSIDRASIVVDRRVAVDTLLKGHGLEHGALADRVRRWLHRMTADWNGTLPQQGDLAGPFIRDIVPALTGSQVDHWS